MLGLKFFSFCRLWVFYLVGLGGVGGGRGGVLGSGVGGGCAGRELKSFSLPIFLISLSFFSALPHASCSTENGKGRGCYHVSDFCLFTYIFLLKKFLTLLPLSENTTLFF